MPIPASVGLYVNWVNGSYSSPTYTAATPDIPNGQTWTQTGSGFSLAVDNDSPWSGQTCVFVTDATNDYINTTVTSAEVSTSGRFFMEGQGRTSGRAQLYIQDNSNPNNAQIIVWSDGSDNLAVRMTWSGARKIAHVALGAFPTDPFKLEVIYDPENADGQLAVEG